MLTVFIIIPGSIRSAKILAMLFFRLHIAYIRVILKTANALI